MGGRRNKKKNSRRAEEGFCHPLIAVKSNVEIGRYLEAKQDIAAGTQLFQEHPLVLGPTFDGGPVCLACYRPVHDADFRCVRCEWPLCSLNCGTVNAERGHSASECGLLRNAKRKPRDLKDDARLYGVIMPLRTLLLKSNSDKWKALTQMESLNVVRQNDEISWNQTETDVVQVVYDMGFDQFKREEIHTVCGYIQINAFAVEKTHSKALYPNVFLLSHDCVPNTTHSVDENFVLTLRSSVNIRRGDKITLSYANTLQGTRQRRQHLKESKYFDCSCKRCSDPTELGSYASAMACSKCSEGKLLVRNPLNSCSDWMCSQCGQTASQQSVQLSLDRLSEMVEASRDANVEYLEKLVGTLEQFLHPSHFLLTSVKLRLSQMYGKVDGFMIQDMTSEALERKLDLCGELMKIWDIIEPGLSRIRGVTLYEIHAPLLLLSLRQFQNGSLSSSRLQTKLKEVKRCLTEADQILEFEPENSPEGQMSLAVKRALVETSRWNVQMGRRV